MASELKKFEERIGISFKNKEGDWTEAKCLGKNIISESEENWPMITADGKYIFFSSNRNNSNHFPDIYWVDAKIIGDLIPKNYEMPNAPNY